MTLKFIETFFKGILFLSPILIFLIMIISTLGLFIGKKEGWHKIDAIYYAFITASTVGYGDFRPTKRVSKLMAILIAITGLIFTGIIVAIALHAVEFSINHEE